MRDKIVFLIVCLCSILSCWQEKSNFPLLIDITLRSPKKENIKLYYVSNSKQAYSERFSKTIAIKGSAALQNISFQLNEIPFRFRIDFGQDGNKDEIFVENLVLQNDTDKIKIQGKELHRFFKPNVYMDIEGGRISRKENASKYDPYMQSTALLHQKMRLIF